LFDAKREHQDYETYIIDETKVEDRKNLAGFTRKLNLIEKKLSDM
jgi:hypothetical protein